MPPENPGDGAGGTDFQMPQIFQPTLDLPAAPGAMLPPQAYHQLFQRRTTAPRAGLGNTRTVHQARRALTLESAQPFVGGLAGDAESPAQQRHVPLSVPT